MLIWMRKTKCWLQLLCYPDVLFGGVYVPLEHYPYYEPSIYGNIAAQISNRERVILVGGFNAPVGHPCISNSDLVQYKCTKICDGVVNNHGK